jgi:hypothetical protein
MEGSDEHSRWVLPFEEAANVTTYSELLAGGADWGGLDTLRAARRKQRQGVRRTVASPGYNSPTTVHWVRA